MNLTKFCCRNQRELSTQKKRVVKFTLKTCCELLTHFCFVFGLQKNRNVLQLVLEKHSHEISQTAFVRKVPKPNWQRGQAHRFL